MGFALALLGTESRNFLGDVFKGGVLSFGVETFIVLNCNVRNFILTGILIFAFQVIFYLFIFSIK